MFPVKSKQLSQKAFYCLTREFPDDSNTLQQYMYVKVELTQCNCFGMVHTLTAFTEEWVEDISNSYLMFIKVFQPVTLFLANLLTAPVNTNWKKTGLSKE